MRYKTNLVGSRKSEVVRLKTKQSLLIFIIFLMIIGGCGKAEEKIQKKFVPLWDKYQNGAYEEAITGFLKLEKSYPKTPFVAKVKVTRANAYKKLNNLPEAENVYLEVAKNFPDSKYMDEAWYGLGEIYKQQKKYPEAVNYFTRVINTFPAGPSAKYAEKSLDEVNFYLFLHPDRSKEKIYTIRQGEKLLILAQKNNMTPGLLARLNGIKDITSIAVGQDIIIPKVKLSLKADLSDRSLTLFNDSKRIKKYLVAIGKDETKTPIGKFVINQKLINPTWYFEGKVYQPNTPENRLGTRWLGISAKGYGIHGTNDPKIVGQNATNGCLRMYNEDVEELYDIVFEGTEVEITE